MPVAPKPDLSPFESKYKALDALYCTALLFRDSRANNLGRAFRRGIPELPEQLATDLRWRGSESANHLAIGHPSRPPIERAILQVRCFGSTGETDTEYQILKARVRAERIEAGPQQDARVESLGVTDFQPAHRLILIAESRIDHGNLRSI